MGDPCRSGHALGIDDHMTDARVPGAWTEEPHDTSSYYHSNQRPPRYDASDGQAIYMCSHDVATCIPMLVEVHVSTAVENSNLYRAKSDFVRNYWPATYIGPDQTCAVALMLLMSP